MQVCFSFQLFSLEKDIVFQSISSAVFNELDTDSYFEHIKIVMFYGNFRRRKRQPTPVFLPGESHGQRTWQAIVHGVARVRHDLATKPCCKTQALGSQASVVATCRLQGA